MMKPDRVKYYLLPFLFALLLFFGGCAPPGNNSGGETTRRKTRVNLRLHNRAAKTASGSSITASIPPIVKVGLKVTADDMDDIIETYPVASGQTSLEISVLVPEGPDRDFKVNLNDARDRTIIKGDALEDISGETVDLDIRVYQVTGGPASPEILSPVAVTDASLVYFFNTPAQTFSGTCDSTLSEIWVDYSFSDSTRVYNPAFDSTFALSTFTAGDTTWSYSHNLVLGYNIFEFFGIDAADIYSFPPATIQTGYDIAPPATSQHAPAKGAGNVPLTTSITLHIKDDFIVKKTSIAMTVEGVSVSSPTITGSEWDYTVTYNPPDFSLGQVVDVTVDAQDFAGNVMPTDIYAFTCLLGPDTIGPTLINLNPVDSATNVPVNANVYFEVDDSNSGVDLNTLNVYFDTTTPVIINGTAWTGYSGSTIAADGSGGYDVTIIPSIDFSYGQVVDVVIVAFDSTGNSGGAVYSFTCVADSTAPTVTAQNPGAGAGGILPSANIYFEIDDPLAGVDLTTLNVVVGGSNAIVSGTAQASFSGSAVAADGSGGFNVTINPSIDFSVGQTVTVSINATDNNGNVMPAVNYSFITGGTLSLLITNPAAISLDTNATSISFAGTCSADTDQIEAHHVSAITDVTLFLPGFTPFSTTWSHTNLLDMGDNNFTFTGYDTSVSPGAFDTIYIRRTILGPGYLKIFDPNQGVDFSTPDPNAYFFGECSADTEKIRLDYTSSSSPTLDTTFFLPGFTPFDTTWTYVDTLAAGVNGYVYTAYDTLNNVGLSDAVNITLNPAYIGPPVITAPYSGFNFGTNISPQTLSGTCDSTNTVNMFIEYQFPFDTTLNTTIPVSSYVAGTPSWSQSVNLNEGHNFFGAYGQAADSSPSARDFIDIYYDTTMAAPIITSPNNGADFNTNKKDWNIAGTTDPDTQDILVNTAPLAAYIAGDTTWQFDTTLHEGMNSFTIQAQDSLGNTSLPAYLNIDLNTHPFRAEGHDGEVKLDWLNMTDPSWQGVVILRRQGAAYPSTPPSDGTAYSKFDSIGTAEVIYSGIDTTTVIDSGLFNYAYYYYMLFPYDSTYTYAPPLLNVAPTRQEITTISKATNDQTEPRIWGDVIAWTDFRSGQSQDIYLRNLSTDFEMAVTFDVTNNQRQPRIWGSRIVYTDTSIAPIGFKLFDMARSSKTTLPIGSPSGGISYDIHSNNVVYAANYSGYNEIYKIDLALSPLASEGVVFNNLLDYYVPAIWDTTVVYEKYMFNPDIYTHGISSLTSEQQVVASTSGQEAPDLWRDVLAWQDNRDGYYDIWYRKLDTTASATRLQNDAASQLNPRIYGYGLVWEDYSYAVSKAEIAFYDLSELSGYRVTNSTTRSKSEPDIWGEKVVWAQDDGTLAPDWNIYLSDHEPTGERELPFTQASNLFGWDIWGDKVVYSDDRNGNPDIFLFDLTSRVEIPICVDAASQLNPAIYENTIVWQDYREGTADIYLHDPVGGDRRLNTVAGDIQSFPDVFERYVVWQDRRNGTDYDIFSLDLYANVETNLVTSDLSSSDQVSPRIHNSKIVWEDKRNVKSDIYGYNLVSGGADYFIVQDVSFDQLHPDIYDGTYVYEQVNGIGDVQVYYFDGEVTTNLSQNVGVEHFGPRVFGNRVVWFKNNGTDNDVYLYDKSEGSLYLLTGQKLDEEGPVLNQDKVLYIRKDTTESRLFLFDLY